MKKRVLKTIFCLSLSAAMLLGEAGAVLADTKSTAKAEVESAAVAEREAQRNADLALENAEEISMDATYGDKVVPAVYTLGDVTGLAYDAATGLLSWNKVAKANEYKVEKYDQAGTLQASATTSDVYMDLQDRFYITEDTAYTFKVTAQNTSELCFVAADVAGIYTDKWNEAAQKWVWGIYTSDGSTLLYEEGVAFDIATSKAIKNADGTTSYTYTLYKYPISSVNPAQLTVVVRTSTKKSVSALTGIKVKETSDTSVTFSVAPETIQSGERVEYKYSNNDRFTSDADKGLFTYSGSIPTNNGVISGNIVIDFSEFTAGDTVYIKAWVYNPNYDYTAVPGQTSENRKSAEVTASYKIPAAVMGNVGVIVTKDSIRLEPYATGTVTGYQYQRKNGKKWVNLAQQGDNYIDKGLKADTKYTYRIRGYIYNDRTGKTSYTDWKTVSATTWGSSLKLKASVASATSVKLTWSKVSGVDGYEIYRVDTDSTYYNTKNGEYPERFNSKTLVKTIKKAKTTTYTDKKLTKGNTYEYMVRAYRTVGKTKCYIDETVSVTLSAKGMTETASYYNAKGQYVVKWNKMTGISGYKVEKYNNKTGKYEVYKSLKKSKTSITLPKVNVGGDDVRYRIRPYKGTKYYNGISGITVYPQLAAVKSIKAVQTAEGVKISWKAVPGANYYKVYRAKKDSGVYNNTTKTYTLGSGSEPVYEVNYEDTSAGINFASTGTTDVRGDDGSVYKQYNYDDTLNYSQMWSSGVFYSAETHYQTEEITGTSVVDKTVTVKSLIPKAEDPAYNKDADTEYNKGEGSYVGKFGKYQKNADGSLKTKDVVVYKGPQVGTEYYYFVIACAKPANGANCNNTEATSIGYGKSAKVVYTKVKAPKASKVSSVKSSKKATVTVKAKKVSGVKGYVIYRSTKKSGTYVQVGTSTSTTYTDNNVVSGKTYYYKVATYKKSENGTFIYSKLSAAKKVKAK